MIDDPKRLDKQRVLNPALLLQGHRSPRKPGWKARLRQRFGRFYLIWIRRMARAARLAHARIMAVSVSQSTEVFEQGRLMPDTAIAGTALLADFDYGKWQDRAWPALSDYYFVPQDSLEFHTGRNNNRYGIHKIAAQIALFPASNPVLLFPGKRQFLFEKLHEIPYHGPDTNVRLSEFKWSSVFRPFFKLNVDIKSNYDTFRFSRSAIYVGGSLNYGHFLTDYYPRLLAILEETRRNPGIASQVPQLAIVYCEDTELEYLLRAHPELHFVNLKGYEGSVISCAELYTTNFIPFPMACTLLRRKIQGIGQEVEQEPEQSVLRPKKGVFLSRRGFARRRVGNEDELIAMLEQLGFDILDVKAFSIEELANRIKDYDVLVSGFGAHTINAIFLKPGSTFYEIVTESFDRSSGWQYNHALFMSAGLNYRRVVAEDARSSLQGQEGTAGVYDWEALADIELIREQVQSIMIGRAIPLVAGSTDTAHKEMVNLSTAPAATGFRKSRRVMRKST